MNDRSIDRWLKWAAVVGPMVSGLVFGCVGYVGGYQAAKEKLENHTIRIVQLEGWKEKQVEFNQTTVVAIERLKVLAKDLQH